MVDLDAVMWRAQGHGSAAFSVDNLVVEFLALQKRDVLGKNAFLSHLYGGIDQPAPEVINALKCKLRTKFIKNCVERLNVDTVWGKGYIL